MSLTQGGQQLPAPSVLPEFSGDVNNLRNFAYSMGGQKLPQGSFMPSPGMTNAASLGNNFFSPGGTGSNTMGYLNSVLQGNFLNPSSNPYLSGTIGSLQSGFQQALGTGMDALNAQFGRAGQSPDSGAASNAATQLARGSMADFNNALSQTLFGQYDMGLSNMNTAASLANNLPSMASFASSLGQAPGQEAYQGLLAQNNLSSLPFQYLTQLMQDTPVSSPSFAPSQPSDLAGWLNLAMHGLDAGAQGYSGYQTGALAAAMG